MRTMTNFLARAIRSPLARLPWILWSCTWATAQGQDQASQLQDLIANASAARQQGDIPRSIQLYQQAVQLNPKWADGWWYVGSMEYGTDSYAPAVIALSHYLELTPTAGPAFALRGLCEFEEETTRTRFRIWNAGSLWALRISLAMRGSSSITRRSCLRRKGTSSKLSVNSARS
jgi:tetratricopeptide (TPR) repeat protein